ncbi:MAG: C1 family peptidase [Bacteroidales bacterium]|nr:C1 family peptidase [Bacteroidales bacterium]
MKKEEFFLALIFLVFKSFSQKEISFSIIENWNNSLKLDKTTKALINAVSNNELNKLTLDRAQLNNLNYNFKYKVNPAGITDQKKSGRCWMFASLNVFRSKIAEKLNVNNFEFSTSYLYFYDLLEKANFAIEIAIETADRPKDDRIIEWLYRNPISDGGVWNSFINLILKYGIVPKDVMLETWHSENTKDIIRILSYKIREYIYEIRKMYNNKASKEKLRERKFEMLKEVHKILVYFLGIPPTEFEYTYTTKDNKIVGPKKYTPLTFMKEVFDEFKADDYVLLMNDPSMEYYKTYEIEYDRNTVEGKNWIYLNLPIDSLKKYAINSLKDKQPLYYSCDVAKMLNSDKGYLSLQNFDFSSLLNIDFKMDKRARIETFESGSSHAMTLIGVDTDLNDKPLRWLVENSWGQSSGYNGMLVITDEWFNEYSFRLVVNKKYLPKSVIEMYSLKPIKLPPWSPMFNPDD